MSRTRVQREEEVRRRRARRYAGVADLATAFTAQDFAAAARSPMASAPTRSAPPAARRAPDTDADLRRSTHLMLRKVTNDLGRGFHFNTAIAAVMEHLNTVSAAGVGGELKVHPAVARESMHTVAHALFPFAPHIADELHAAFGGETDLMRSPWPSVDDAACESSSITIVVQVMGKLRGRIEVPADADRDAILAAAKADASVARHLEGKNIIKEIVVPGRLVNFVV